MQTIIVTGGAGYIGSHTTVELQEKGYHVVILDNLCNSTRDMIDRIEGITGMRPDFHDIDITDRAKLTSVLDSYNSIDGIIHFAALKAVGESVSNPLSYYRNNVDGLISVLEGMQKASIENIIFSSSATVYGQPDVLPATESTPEKKANSPYGATKQMGETILADFVRAEKKQAIALRYFNPIGAHASGLIGELPQGEPNNLMPYITQTAAGIREKLHVFGKDYDTKDGTAVRDYIHVVDLAKAHVIAIERLLNNQNEDTYETFNLGTGLGYTVLEVIQSFEKTTGVDLAYEFTDRREGDIEKIYASTDKANTVLGWKANLSLDDMTRSHWNWEKSYRGL